MAHGRPPDDAGPVQVKADTSDLPRNWKGVTMARVYTATEVITGVTRRRGWSTPTTVLSDQEVNDGGTV